IVGGNMEGFTRVMTTSIALETSKGELPIALGLGIVLLVVVLLLNVLMGWVVRAGRQGAADDDAPRGATA
ncbi:MAG: ABC transporter permease, partial [Burkholderiaceae bacterium]|nr:ABC transporter permease [Burkholderiaceae bacterium]